MNLRRARRWTAPGRGAVLLALTLLTGQIVDRTTGQPLTGVDVTATPASGSAKIAPSRTNDAGTYALRNVPPGHYTLTVSSDDVPPQTFALVVKTAKAQHFNITACSTTLDYSCASVLR